MPETVLARLNRAGMRFEIFVYAEPAYEFREGKRKSLEGVLAVEQIFTDARKSLKASTQDLKKAFGTDDVYKIAEVILKEGDVQLTAEYRRKLKEERLRWIVNYIHKNFVDPKTGLPHPPSRIEKALSEAKVKIDPLREPEAQIKEVVESLRKVLPLKSGAAVMEIVVPSTSYGRLRSLLSGQGDVLSEDWSKDGTTVKITLRAPLGSQVLILEKVGQAGGEVKVIREEG
ncbi:MAG: ribosome assembly factor SBDS [Candidatus Korarchaeota archaeon]|nr:ribosome assembly factor SBDS [Candidatus Korarchaeota archaeon]